MSFPIHVGGVTVSSPPELAALVRREASAPAGSLLLGQRPARWLMGLVASGALPRTLAVGLAAALVRHREAGTICEGARLAEALQEPRLGGLLLLALDGHDHALLLRPDPADPGRSVEDTLLLCAARCADMSDAQVRARTLQRLRHAGLPGLELPLLMAHGTLEDLQRWLPAILAEGLEAEDVPHLLERLRRNDRAAQYIATQLQGVDPAVRQAVVDGLHGL